MKDHGIEDHQFPGIVVERATLEGGQLVLVGRCRAVKASCPACQQGSARVHSYRTRILHDLPCVGESVILRLQVRRFRCLNPACPQRTFTETLAPLAQRGAHRTDRLKRSLWHVAMSLAGAAGARLAQGLGMPSSGPTLLRLLRDHPPNPHCSDQLGIDDWAWRRGQRYGTVIVDLANHRPVDLLPDRTADTVTAWLQAHPGVTLITRDRASDFATAAKIGAPGAVQVADRWHLLQNMRLVLERLCQRAFADLQRLPLSPELSAQISWTAKYRSGRRSSGEEARKQAIYDQRQRRFEAVQRLKRAGWSIKQIARHLRVSWATARDNFKRERFLPMSLPRLRPSRLDRFAEYLQTRWDAGHHNARQLWREIRDQGFSGSVRMVMLWAQVRREPIERHPGRRRFSQAVPTETRQAFGLPAASRLAWLLIRSPEQLDVKQQPLLTHLLKHPDVAAGYALAQQFTRILRERRGAALEDWLSQARSSTLTDLRQFATALQRDHDAVLAAITLPWSNGPVEGHVNRLKLIKRQMYGRANLDLLRIRVLGKA